MGKVMTTPSPEAMLKEIEARQDIRSSMMLDCGDPILAQFMADIESVLSLLHSAHAREAVLRSALESHECPRPIGDDITVGQCIAAGKCGCYNSVALSPPTVR